MLASIVGIDMRSKPEKTSESVQGLIPDKSIRKNVVVLLHINPQIWLLLKISQFSLNVLFLSDF